MKRTTVHLLALSCLLLFAISAAFAQQAQITGTVTDPHDTAVAGALVQVVNQVTGARIEVKTNESGVYSAPALESGSYQITVSAQGFGPSKSTVITLAAGQSLVQDVKLAVGTVESMVTVSAFGEGLAPVPAPNPITAVYGDELEILAGPGHSNAFQVADLVPGVIANTTDPYGLSFTRSLNDRGRSDFFLGRTINGLPLYALISGSTTDLFDVENVQSERVYNGALVASEGFGASNGGGVLEQTLLDPRNAPWATVEQGFGSSNFHRTFLRAGTGELRTGTALFASGSMADDDNWKGPGGGTRNNITGGLRQRLGSAGDFDVYYVYNHQYANTYEPLNSTQIQNLTANYNLAYIPSLSQTTTAKTCTTTLNCPSYLSNLNFYDFTDNAVLANFNYRFSPITTFSFSPYYWRDNGMEYSASSTNINGWPMKKNTEGFTLSYDIRPMTSLRLTVGYWFESASPDPPPVSKNTFTVNSAGQLAFSSWSSIGAFTHHMFNAPYTQVQFTKGSTVVTAGVRLQFYQTGSANYFLTTGLPNVPYQDIFSYGPKPNPNMQTVSKTYTDPLPNAGIQQRITDNLKLDLSYSRKIDRIDLGPQESTYVTYSSYFQKDGVTLQDLWNLLKPETDDVIDFVPIYQRGRLQIIPDFYFIKAHNKEVLAINPLVVAPSTGLPLAYYQSNVNTTGYGLDFAVKYRVTNALNAYVAANSGRESYDSNTILSQTSATAQSIMLTKGKQIPNDPKETFKAMLTYSTRGFDASFINRYVSARYGVADDSQRVAPYSTSDMSLTYHFGANSPLRGAALNVSTLNLFNRKYIGVIAVNEDSLSSVSYYAGPTRTIAGALTYNFSRR